MAWIPIAISLFSIDNRMQMEYNFIYTMHALILLQQEGIRYEGYKSP